MKKVVKKERAAVVNKSPYSGLVADRILERVAKGESLSSICKDSGFPNASTVMDWILFPDEDKRPGFAAAYEKAETIGLHMRVHEILDISDDSGKDTVTRIFRGKRVKVVDHENINRDRLRVESRKWLVSKRLAEKYGDTIKHEHSGSVDLVARLQAGRERAAKATTQLTIDAAAEVVIEQKEGEDEV